MFNFGFKFARLSGKRLPPSLAGKLLAYWSGKNTDNGLGKDDAINGYDITACEGPCLTLAVGDTMTLPMNDTPASNMGTAVFTYDGLTATVTTAGTIYGVMSTNGLEFAFNEGVGTKFRDTTGTYEGTITAVASGTMWTENTQDDYFAAMEYGWYENDPDDGGQYIYDPSTTPYFNLQLIVSGLGSITIDSTAYTAGTYVLEDLFGATAMTASYGAGEDEVVWTGDTVTGTYPSYSISMDGHKTITGAFGSAITYFVDEDFEGAGTPSGWATNGGGINFNSTTAPAPLAGAQSLQITSYGSNTDTLNFTDQDHVFIGFQFEFDSMIQGSVTRVISLPYSGNEAYFGFRSNGRIITRHGSVANESALSTVTTGTKYYVWVEWEKSTGADDGIMRVWLGTSGVFSSAVLTNQTLDGNGVNDIPLINVGHRNSNTGGSITWDNLKVANAAIGDM